MPTRRGFEAREDQGEGLPCNPAAGFVYKRKKNSKGGEIGLLRTEMAMHAGWITAIAQIQSLRRLQNA